MTFLGHADGARRRQPARRAGRSRPPRTTRWRDTQLRRNLGHATTTIRAKRAARRRRAARLAAAARGRRGDQGRRAGPPRHATWCSSRSRSPRAAASCTGRATPTRPTASSPRWCRPPARDEVVKVKSMATQEIGLNEALEAAGHRRHRDRPRRADRAARPRPPEPHPGAGDPPQPRRDPRDLPARDARRRPATSPTSRRALAEAARRHLRRKFLHGARSRSAAPTSPSPRPARWPSSSPRATAGCA